MSGEKVRPDRLEAFKRWKSAELEEARTRMVQLNEVATQKLAAVDRIEGEIAALHSLVREQSIRPAPLNAEALLRLSAFNGHQQQLLHSARESHDQAARQAQDAQQGVLDVFERLSVVKRLLHRRQGLAGKAEQRSLQKRLDEGALSRARSFHHQTTDPED